MHYHFHTTPADLTNHPERNESFVQLSGDLSSDELDRIREYGDQLTLRPLGLFGIHDERDVKGRVTSIEVNDETRWLYEKLSAFVAMVNAETFNYDLTGFQQPFSYLRFDADLGEHFDYHLDITAATSVPRKLSFVLQLSEPDEYEGGDLEILGCRGPVKMRKGKGVFSVFPSYQVHRVTPVTAGQRRTMTMFVGGPNFR